jgi:hypothetical protein
VASVLGRAVGLEDGVGVTVAVARGVGEGTSSGMTHAVTRMENASHAAARIGLMAPSGDFGWRVWHLLSA